MVYLVTSSGTEDAWGKPYAVFTDKAKLRKWIEADFKRVYSEHRFLNVKVEVKKVDEAYDEYHSVNVHGETPPCECDCGRRYEIRELPLDPSEDEADFFGN
jgi:hypothetical protein